MSVEQVVFVLAGAVCIVGAVLAVTHRDPRTSGISLTATLFALAVLYAALAAPAVAAAVIVVAVFATLPFVVHLSVSGSALPAARGPNVSGAALLLGAAILGILAVAIARGEVPLNVSVRSADGYDLAAIGDLLTGRVALAAGGSVLVLLGAAVAARSAHRDRRSRP
jgi:NADH:ubiquinone oxidoreductase subunit 6 (subunit J)